MRPSVLDVLFSHIIKLDGIGEKTFKNYERLCGTRIKNLIFHFPSYYLDRRNIKNSLNGLQSGEYASLTVDVVEHIPATRHSKAPYKVICTEGIRQIDLIFFGKSTDTYVKAILPVNKKAIVNGKVYIYNHRPQMTHPDYIVSPSAKSKIPDIEPVYRLTKGVTNRQISKTVKNALSLVDNLPEWIDSNVLVKRKWSSWKESIVAMHKPNTIQYDELQTYQDRLVYDELFSYQLVLALTKKEKTVQEGIAFKSSTKFKEKFTSALPFKLTDGQIDVAKEISFDMESNSRMIRLLQGDVGSGKTVVSIIAALDAIECGYQVAIMSPTEILSQQHALSIGKMIDDSALNEDVKIVLLTGKDKGKSRKDKLELIENGEVNIIVGTHALFQEHVKFSNLGLAIIDEQHRFGVKQRLLLSSKGNNIDLLLMSATPIPRTLTLTLYGDMDVSILSEKPSSRKDIETFIMPKMRIPTIMSNLINPISKGEKIYWICPLVEETEGSELTAVSDRLEALRAIYGEKVAMVHGKMKATEKDNAMLEFKNGNVDILVATTVVEVGVDVPEATVIIIENANQFGLSQLHQLRGRVGRGNKQSSCILIYSNEISETSKKRLQIMRETNDGFKIAEEDLNIRGGGDILGTKQSGMPEFIIADIHRDRDILYLARDAVKRMVSEWDNIPDDEKIPLKVLLYLFDYDNQMQLLNA